MPFVALPYSTKVGGFLDDLEIEMPPLKQVNAGQLIAYIDRWWDLRRQLQARLEKGAAGDPERGPGAPTRSRSAC